MSVLTAPRSAAFTRQLPLPFAPHSRPAIKDTRGTGAAGPLQEPPAVLAKTSAPVDKPGGN
jgi:hypothetical protein